MLLIGQKFAERMVGDDSTFRSFPCVGKVL